MAGAIESAGGHKTEENPPGPLLGPRKSSILTPWGHQNTEKACPGGFGKKRHVLTSKSASLFQFGLDLGVPRGSPWGVIFDMPHAAHQLMGVARALPGAFQGLETLFPMDFREKFT